VMGRYSPEVMVLFIWSYSLASSSDSRDCDLTLAIVPYTDCLSQLRTCITK
jgi:hypothetical protein